MRKPVLALFLAALAIAARAQDGLVVPSLDWRTVETKHFVIHYPKAAEAWTLDFASRIDARVRRRLGARGERAGAARDRDGAGPEQRRERLRAPLPERPGGLLLADAGGPVERDRRADRLGGMLAVHEYAHVAHLTRPSRNPAEAKLGALVHARLRPARARVRRAGPPKATRPSSRGGSPARGVRTAPGARRSSASGRGRGSCRRTARSTTTRASSAARWRTSSARPISSGWSRARGRAIRALPYVWRRMSARTPRGFDEAFAGVFGAPPAELYGRFVAEVTAQSLELERALLADSAQARRRGAGHGRPAAELEHGLAGALAERFLPRAHAELAEQRRRASWSGRRTSAPDTAAARRRAEELRARSARRRRRCSRIRRPRRRVATRWPRGGRSLRFAALAPRWPAAAARSGAPGTGNGEIRRDLFLWDARHERGAARHARGRDPAGRRDARWRSRDRGALRRGDLRPRARGSGERVHAADRRRARRA